MNDTDFLDVWLSLFYQYPTKNYYLNLIGKFYNKSSYLKNALLNICEEYSYLEWVQHKIFHLLSDSEFNFSTVELSNIWKKYHLKLTPYSKKSFYLIFLNHLDYAQSLFPTIIRSIRKEENSGDLFLREWLLYNFDSDYFNRYKNVSRTKVLELAKKLDYAK